MSRKEGTHNTLLDCTELSSANGHGWTNGRGVYLVELAILLLIGALTLSSINSYSAIIPSGLVVMSFLWQLAVVRSAYLKKLLRSRRKILIAGKIWIAGKNYIAGKNHIDTSRSSRPKHNFDKLLPVLHWVLLGGLLPLASVFPRGALTLSVVVALIADYFGGRLKHSEPKALGRVDRVELIEGGMSPLLAFAPFLLVCFAWIALAFCYEFPFFYLKYLPGLLLSFPSSFFSLSKLAPVTVSLIENIAPILLLLIVWGRLALHPAKGRALLGGIVIAWIVALVWAVFQAVGITELPLRRNGEFWLKQGRFWGTFSDPNAFGVFSTIFLSHLISLKLKRLFKYPLVLFSIMVPLLSGSRSFVMGLMLLGGFWIFEKRAQITGELRALAHKRQLMKIALFGALIIVGSILGFVVALKPSSLERLLLSINPETAATAFFSRAVFWKSCLWIWLKYPLIGGGLGSFRDNFPLAVEHFGWNLNGWIDNANTFYLGILAELGLLGFVTFCLSLLNLKWRKECSRPISRAPVVISAVLLFFGPHLEFMEVAILVGLVLSVTVMAPNLHLASVRRSWSYSLGAAMIGSIFIATSERLIDYGIFTPVKRSLETRVMEKPIWLSPKASIVRPCEGGTIKFRVVDERSAEALDHPYFGGVNRSNRITLSTADETREINLSNSSAMVELVCKEPFERVSVTSTTPWIPKLCRGGKDARFLGVKVALLTQRGVKTVSEKVE